MFTDTNTVQQLLRKTLNFISPFLRHGPNRPELNSVDYKI